MSDSGVAPFRYHPDPVATGSAEPSDAACQVCARTTGFRYAGPIYSRAEEIEEICLDCIRDGSAAARLAEPIGPGGPFTSVDGAPPGAAASVLDEVERRTPGFSGWQQERWLFHCGDAAAFLGRAGYAELQSLPDALDSIRAECREMRMRERQVEDYLRWLHIDGDGTAYLFRCLTTRTYDVPLTQSCCFAGHRPSAVP